MAPLWCRHIDVLKPRPRRAEEGTKKDVLSRVCRGCVLDPVTHNEPAGVGRVLSVNIRRGQHAESGGLRTYHIVPCGCITAAVRSVRVYGVCKIRSCCRQCCIHVRRLVPLPQASVPRACSRVIWLACLFSVLSVRGFWRFWMCGAGAHRALSILSAGCPHQRSRFQYANPRMAAGHGTVINSAGYQMREKREEEREMGDLVEDQKKKRGNRKRRAVHRQSGIPRPLPKGLHLHSPC